MNSKAIHVFAAMLLWVAPQTHAAEAGVIPMTARQQQSLGIVVTPVSTATAVAGNRLPGEIAVPAGQERVVSSAQSGLIDALFVAEGQSVKKGQPLAHISSPDLVVLQREYLQALTQHRLAKNTLDRDAALFREGIIAERRYLATQSAQEELSAVAAQRRQALKLAGMGDAAIVHLESRGEFSSGLTLSAPIAGMVLEQRVTAGQRIEPATPLFRIGRLTPLWLEIRAPIEILPSVGVGMPVRIPQYQAEGRVIAIIRNINKSDQTMHVRAEITKNGEMLAPGQFVEAEIAAAVPAGNRFTVPKGAVVRQGADSYVFMQTGKGFLPRKVMVSAEQRDLFVVTGLAGTEKVATSGTVAIKAAWIGTGGE